MGFLLILVAVLSFVLAEHVCIERGICAFLKMISGGIPEVARFQPQVTLTSPSSSAPVEVQQLAQPTFPSASTDIPTSPSSSAPVEVQQLAQPTSPSARTDIP